MCFSRPFLACITVTATLTLFSACMEPLLSTIDEVIVAENTPGGSTVPLNGAFIGPDDTVRIRFSESMDRGSLELQGSLAENAAEPEWRSILSADDAVELSPASSWPLYEELSLSARATSARGYLSRPIDASVTAVDTIVYVSQERGSPDGIGSLTSPFASISMALERVAERRADGALDRQEIRVAAGQYTSELGVGPGVLLVGGYDQDFVDRSPGTSTVQGPEGSASTLRLEDDGETVIDAVVDGFTVNEPINADAFVDPEGSGARQAVVYLNNGRLLLRDSTVVSSHVPGVLVTSDALSAELIRVHVRGPSSGEVLVALQVEGSIVGVEESTFELGNLSGYGMEAVATVVVDSARLDFNRSVVVAPRGEVAESMGIFLRSQSGSLRFDNGLIDGGSGGSAYGIHSVQDDTEVSVRNSTIRVGDASESSIASAVGILGVGNLAIGFGTDVTLVVQNSLIFGSGQPNSAGISYYEFGTIRNNNIFNVGTAGYLVGSLGFTQSQSIAELEDPISIGPTASGNLALDPVLVDSRPLYEAGVDWSLSDSSPSEIAEGGLLLGDVGVDAQDFVGVSRGGTWSIGAFQP